MIRIVAGGAAGSSLKGNEELVLIQVNRSEGNKHTKESVWARSLGNDLYEVKGPLHLVADLNSGDIVRAVVSPSDAIPSISEVVTRSGFRTLHIAFIETVRASDQENMLEVITQSTAQYEKPFDRFYTVEVNPHGNYSAVCEYLEGLTLQGLIMYEPRVSLDALLRFRFSE